MSVIVDNVSLKYSGNREDYILKDLSLEVDDGEFVCLLGPSGCGKSTLLGMVAGFVKPSSGEIRMNDQKITRPDIARTLVFQEYALFPWLNVIDNVAFGMRYSVKDKEERYLLAIRYLTMVGLVDQAKDHISQLSGGMKQRVAIARAFAVKPKLLLMDEPFGALDDKTRADMQKQLNNIWLEFSSSVMFVTHSIDEALILADRIIVMDRDEDKTHGRIKADIRVKAMRPRTLNELSLYRNQVVDALYGTNKSSEHGFDAMI